MASRATAPSPTWNPCNSHTGIAHYQLRTNAEMFKILEPDLAKIWCDPSPVNARIEAVLPAAARVLVTVPFLSQFGPRGTMGDRRFVRARRRCSTE